jgi:hypothetical protein
MADLAAVGWVLFEHHDGARRATLAPAVSDAEETNGGVSVFQYIS